MHGDLKSPPRTLNPLLPVVPVDANSEDQDGHGDLDYDGEEADIAISSDEEGCA